MTTGGMESHNNSHISSNSTTIHTFASHTSLSLESWFKNILFPPVILLILEIFLGLSYRVSKWLPLSGSMRGKVDHVHAWSTEALQLLFIGAIVDNATKISYNTMRFLGKPCTSILCQTTTLVLVILVVNIFALYSVDLIEARIAASNGAHPYNGQCLVLTKGVLCAERKSMGLRRGRMEELSPVTIHTTDECDSEGIEVIAPRTRTVADQTTKRLSTEVLPSKLRVCDATTQTSLEGPRTTITSGDTTEDLSYLDLAVSEQNLDLFEHIHQTLVSTRFPHQLKSSERDISSLEFAFMRQEKLRLMSQQSHSATDKKPSELLRIDTVIIETVERLEHLDLALSDQQLHHIEKGSLTFAPSTQSATSPRLYPAHQDKRTSRISKKEFEKRRAIWSPLKSSVQQ